MVKIQSLVTFTIKKGKTKKFQKIAKKCIKLAKKTEKGTLHYIWYYNANQSKCLVHESYKNSKAFLKHTKNVGPLVAQLLKISTVSSVAIGKPSKKLKKMMDGFKMELYHREAGF